MRPSWKFGLTVFAIAAAVLAFWITLDAQFLAYPAWLAVQKADFILGPIGVGLYWMYRRPENRFGVLLIVLGLCGVPYILESSTDPALFSAGVLTEFPLFLMITIVILAFPGGRLDGTPERLIIAFQVAHIALVMGVIVFPPHVPGFTISDCRLLCPGYKVGETSFTHSWLIRDHVLAVMPVVLSLATAGVVAWRFAIGTPPRRRALAIGAPVALLFLLVEAGYRGLFVFAPKGLAPSARPVQDVLQWADAATRSLVWYGFLFALIAAELYAARVLRDVVRRSRGRPPARELEAMLREPLGDPALRVGFWNADASVWMGADGGVLEPPAAGQTLTRIEREGGPAMALMHDCQLSEDPELLEAAGDVLMLAVENRELDASWKASLRENNELIDQLRASRSRIVGTAERERARLERDLHDGAQQRLVAVQVKLKMAEQDAPPGPLADQLEEIRLNAVEAGEELRSLAHGIYPTVLRAHGLAEALRSVARSAPIAVEVEDAGIGRAPEAVEAAIYFCAREAIQNAAKHARTEAHVAVTLARRDGDLDFTVVDDGAGMVLNGGMQAFGLSGMVDRIEAAGGELEIASAPGRGTRVHGRIPDPGGGTEVVSEKHGGEGL
jgi:signal transduction histidine kinase